jgi:RNA polymerase sigma factor (sigma-70 family)
MSDHTRNLFRDLFLRNKRDLLAYLTRRVGSDDAPDLLQETFVRVLRRDRLERFPIERNRSIDQNSLNRKDARAVSDQIGSDTALEAMEDPPSWLRRIALNLARDHVRRRRTEGKYLDFGELPEDAPCDAARPDEIVEAEERWRILYATIEGLPPRCREVFVLYLLESLSLGEIAKRLGMSQNMAQKHMRLAVRRCLEALR